MEPILSIIVPVYNGAPFVAKTIERLLAETVSKEIILVNDGSTDNSLDILNSYAAQYNCIRVINQPNKGVSAARNIGIREAKGKYIYFNDCDDTCAEGALTFAVSRFTDSIDAVVFSYQHVAANGAVIKAIRYIPTNEYTIKEFASFPEKLVNSHIINCVGTTVRRLAVIHRNNIFYDETLSIYEDMIFAFKYMSCVKRLYYIDEPYFSYTHINPKSLFLGYQKNKAQGTEPMLRAVESFFKEALNVKQIPYFNTFVQLSFLAAIKNEATQSCFSVESHGKLAFLSKSSYLEACNVSNSKLPFLYYVLLKKQNFTYLIFIAGIRRKIKGLCWRILIPIGRFVKKVFK